MRVVEATSFGGPEVLVPGAAPDPVAGPGEVVVQVAAATLLTQLSHATGAKVIAAARGEAKLALAQRLGAAAMVDYDEPGWADQVLELTGGVGVSVVFDGTGGPIGRDALGSMVPGGRFIGYGSAAGGFAEIDTESAAAQGVKVVMLMDLLQAGLDWPAAGRRSLDEVAAGNLEVIVGQTFPLEDAAAAHDAIESRTALGRTVLTV